MLIGLNEAKIQCLKENVFEFEISPPPLLSLLSTLYLSLSLARSLPSSLALPLRFSVSEPVSVSLRASVSLWPLSTTAYSSPLSFCLSFPPRLSHSFWVLICPYSQPSLSTPPPPPYIFVSLLPSLFPLLSTSAEEPTCVSARKVVITYHPSPQARRSVTSK